MRRLLLRISSACRSRTALTGGALVGLLSCAGLAGCASSDLDSGLLGIIRPYRLEVVQGNVVTSEMMADLREGLTRDQVRAVLGTPLLADIFHADRWDYVFTIRRQGTAPQQRRVTLFFNGERLARFLADPLPSEREFVNAINIEKPDRRVPRLDLTEEELGRLPLPKVAAAPVTEEPASGPQRAYPALEPVTR